MLRNEGMIKWSQDIYFFYMMDRLLPYEEISFAGYIGRKATSSVATYT